MSAIFDYNSAAWTYFAGHAQQFLGSADPDAMYISIIYMYMT